MMYQLKNVLKTLVTNNFVGKRCLVVEVQNFADVYVSITRLFTDFKGLYFTLYFMLIFAKVGSAVGLAVKRSPHYRKIVGSNPAQAAALYP